MTLPPPDQQSIRDAIAREESRLLRLEEERTEAQARLLSLEAALAAQSDSTEISLSGNSGLSASSTAVEKIALFLETDPPLVVDADTVLALPVGAQRLEMVAR